MCYCGIEWHFVYLGKAVALHQDSTAANANLYNQGGTVYPFLSRVAGCMLNLADKHSITLIQAYVPTHLNPEADYIFWGSLFLE